MRAPRGGVASDRLDRVKNQTRFKVKKKVTFDLKPQICLSTPQKLTSIDDAGKWTNNDINQCGDGRPTSPTLAAGTPRYDRQKLQACKCLTGTRPRRSCLKKRRAPSSCFPAFPFAASSYKIIPSKQRCQASLFYPSLISPSKLVSPASLFRPASLFSRASGTPRSPPPPVPVSPTDVPQDLLQAAPKSSWESGEDCGCLAQDFATMGIAAPPAVAKVDNSVTVDANPFSQKIVSLELSSAGPRNGNLGGCSGLNTRG